MGKFNFQFKTIIYLCLLSSLSGCSFQGDKTANPATGQTNTGAATVRRVSVPEGDAAEPALATDGAGNVYALYVEHGADKSGDLYLRRFSSDLKIDSARVLVNPNRGEVKAWRGDQPTIKVGTGNKVYVAWNQTVKTGDGTPANDLMLSVSSDGGNTFAAPVKINDDTVPASHGMHAMAVDGENVYFAWLDERYLKKMDHGPASKGGEMHHGEAEPNAELYFAISKDGGKTFSPNKKIAANICPCCKAQMTIAANGKAYISWRQVLPGDMRHIAVASSADNGETFSEPVIASDDKWQINACPVSGAPLLAGENDMLKVAWYTAGEAGAAGLYWAESKDGGRTFSARTLLSEGMAMGTSVMLSGDRVAWNANGKIFLEKVPAQAAAGTVQDLGEGELPAAVAAGNAVFVSYIKIEGGKRSVWLKRTEN